MCNCPFDNNCTRKNIGYSERRCDIRRKLDILRVDSEREPRNITKPKNTTLYGYNITILDNVEGFHDFSETPDDTIFSSHEGILMAQTAANKISGITEDERNSKIIEILKSSKANLYFQNKE